MTIIYYIVQYILLFVLPGRDTFNILPIGIVAPFVWGPAFEHFLSGCVYLSVLFYDRSLYVYVFSKYVYICLCYIICDMLFRIWTTFWDFLVRTENYDFVEGRGRSRLRARSIDDISQEKSAQLVNF